jgi:hypothetical protein
MPAAWIQLQCPACEDVWEADPTELPSPDGELTCEGCGTTDRTATFMKTKRSLEVLQQFHA